MERSTVGTIDDLHESATKITGLTDFGSADYRAGLGVLLDALNDEAGLTPLGRKVFRAFLRGALVARALSEAQFAAHPDPFAFGMSSFHRAMNQAQHSRVQAIR